MLRSIVKMPQDNIASDFRTKTTPLFQSPVGAFAQKQITTVELNLHSCMNMSCILDIWCYLSENLIQIWSHISSIIWMEKFMWQQ